MRSAMGFGIGGSPCPRNNCCGGCFSGAGLGVQTAGLPHLVPCQTFPGLMAARGTEPVGCQEGRQWAWALGLCSVWCKCEGW